MFKFQCFLTTKKKTRQKIMLTHWREYLWEGIFVSGCYLLLHSNTVNVDTAIPTQLYRQLFSFSAPFGLTAGYQLAQASVSRELHLSLSVWC
jgi:hypothetical protein